MVQETMMNSGGDKVDLIQSQITPRAICGCPLTFDDIEGSVLTAD